MEELTLEEIKEEFLQIFYDNIERDGAEELLEFLERSDFFTAPASTRFHSAFEGGLCQHSVNVYKRFVKLLEGEYGQQDICIGVPAVIGKNGVEKILSLKLTDEEKALFEKSAAAVHKTNAVLKEINAL